MKKLFLLFILISVFSFAQKKEKPIRGNYTYHLLEVENPFKNGTVNKDLDSFSDSLIVITFIPSSTQIGFKLENKTDKNIKIDWNQVLIIDIDGGSKKVFHSGVRYIERDKEQAPTIIYKGTNITDLITPIQNAYYASGRYGGWRTKPLIDAPVVGISFYYAYDPNLVGKTFKAVIPINIEDKTFEYVYTFEVSFIPKDAKK
ncbi:hypothetical protein [Chryseobacterium sp. A321]